MKKYSSVIELLKSSSEYLDGAIKFDCGSVLYSSHEHDCCENHYLCLDDLTLEDFDGLLFDLDGLFFSPIVEYGIELLPINGYGVKIAGYGYNNGFYSSELTLNLEKWVCRKFNITDCQKVSGE